MYSLMAQVEGGYIFIGSYPTELGARRIANRRVKSGEYKSVRVYGPGRYFNAGDEPLYVRERG